MNLNKESMGKIRRLILFTIFILVVLWNYQLLFAGVKIIGRVLLPFAIGGSIAFVLNVPMVILEEKIFKKISFLFITAILMLSMTLPMIAQGNVTFNAGTKDFVFKPGSDESPTDLFSSFKDVMPGDKLTDTIKIVNEKVKDVAKHTAKNVSKCNGCTMVDELLVGSTARNTNVVENVNRNNDEADLPRNHSE